MKTIPLKNNTYVHALGRLALSALLLASATAASAQTAAPPEARNVIHLAANGSVEAQQDWLTVTLSTTREGTDAGAVQSYLRQAVESALAELKKTAQPGAMEVRSGAFNLRPRYANDGKINGWVGSSELVLEGSDFARIGTAAAKAQPLTIAGLDFSLSRQARAQLETQAQALAIANFKTRAAEIARGFGFADYSLREVNVGTSDQQYSPRPRVMAMAMAKSSVAADAPPVPMESGKTLVLVTVSGSVQLK